MQVFCTCARYKTFNILGKKIFKFTHDFKQRDIGKKTKKLQAKSWKLDLFFSSPLMNIKTNKNVLQ